MSSLLTPGALHRAVADNDTAAAARLLRRGGVAASGRAARADSPSAGAPSAIGAADAGSSTADSITASASLGEEVKRRLEQIVTPAAVAQCMWRRPVRAARDDGRLPCRLPWRHDPRAVWRGAALRSCR